MSSSEAGSRDASLSSRRAMLAAALAVAALAGGCLQPLYAENTRSVTGGSIKETLKEVDVPEIKGLIGHYLRNELVFELDGGGEPDRTKRLKFDTKIAESIEVVTVDYANGRADSAILVATATWTVTEIGSGKVVSKGTNIVRAPYERSSQRFATVRAARDAQIRAAKNLATLIRGQMAADLVAG
ncbi:LPS assembly lipoprotein LptE [Bosea sp. 124]|uniref:LPS assembly lipoprotein LptE n=1 Tax=Bosea sp. 124 TaxID=2135642 RepID=UPI000D3D6726|nr:LPS assembly lipoprotein LptE [Bosea sp. 124]